MTKKSLGRLQRDQEKLQQDQAMVKFHKDKEVNKAWDELKDIHQQLLISIMGISTEVGNMFSVPEINNFLENTNQTVDLIRCLSDDTKTLSTRIASIFESHKDKSGGWTTEDEFFSTVQIFEQYHAISSEISGLIFPNYQILANQYTAAVVRAEEIVKKENDAKALTDPNVISDIVPKESIENNDQQ
jgi:hypothetical protein